MLQQIKHLDQQVFTLEYSPETPDAVALNNALYRCAGLEDSNRVLGAQLAAATTLVEQSRAPLRAPPPLPPPAALGSAVDIRHPTLHRSPLNMVQGIARTDDFQSANSLDEWYTDPADPAPARLQSLGHAPCPQHQLHGSGLPTTHCGGPHPGPAAAAPPVFNAFQFCPGGGAPPQAGPTARLRASAPTPGLLRAPGPGGPPAFVSQQSLLAPPAPPQLHQAPPGYAAQLQFTPLAQQGRPQYLPPLGFHSMLSDLAPSEPPAFEERVAFGDVDSSDLESDTEVPNDPSGNAARRAKAARKWKMYSEFNGTLAFTPIPDHASKFKHWKDLLRTEVTSYSKVSKDAYRWILRVEENTISDESLKTCKRKWDPLDSKIRTALTKVAQGEIRTMFELLAEEGHVRFKRQISGVYMLRMVYRRFQSKNSLSQFFDYTDLSKVTLKSDAQLETFLQDWRMKLNGLERPECLPSAARLEMFYRQLRNSTVMKYDIDVYKRMDDQDTDRAYNTLVANVERIIRDQRNLKVQSQLGHGGSAPPALPAPAGTVCRYHTNGTCQKGNACDMIHDNVAKKAQAALVRAGGASGDKPGGRSAAGGGGPPAAKGGGKGPPKAKAAPGPGGRTVSTKGGNPESKLPCYANFEGTCKEATCRLHHRSMTPAEITTYESSKVTRASRAASPGAPAAGVCPDFLKGSCVLGAQCSMSHPDEVSKGAQKRAAKAKAKAAAGP